MCEFHNNPKCPFCPKEYQMPLQNNQPCAIEFYRKRSYNQSVLSVCLQMAKMLFLCTVEICTHSKTIHTESFTIACKKCVNTGTFRNSNRNIKSYFCLNIEPFITANALHNRGCWIFTECLALAVTISHDLRNRFKRQADSCMSPLPSSPS